MRLNLKVAWLKKLGQQGGTKVDDYSYRQPGEFVQVDGNRFDDTDFTLLLDIAKIDPVQDGVRGLTMKLNQYFKVKASPAEAKITRLEVLATGLRAYLMPTAHRWLFESEEDGQMLCWYVVQVQYSPPDERHGSPASTQMTLAALCGRNKEEKHVTWSHDDLHGGVTIPELLRAHDLYVETKELVAEYEAGCARYGQLYHLTGHQFRASGSGFVNDRYSYTSGIVSMIFEGVPTRVVMDDEYDDSENRKHGAVTQTVVSAAFWKEGKVERFHSASDSDDAVVTLPLQPYVNVFDLVKHRFVLLHVSNLTEYAYDKTLVEKLVLEPDKKNLVAILSAGTDIRLEDIVKGKAGGVIVICTGPPGTGKTLTAEVFSEEIRRPLYSVQCSQLGTSEEELEKKLVRVLNRAERWKAILLLDEADVYVNTRGSDIQQNAIVGVFLRVLEYYRGVMFMTSNRDTEIDDAIMSRATAWIQYTYPDQKRLTGIWSVLSAQYGVVLTASDLEALVQSKKLGHISGRTVRNLLKLARLLVSKADKPVTVTTLEYVSQFLDLDGQIRKANPEGETPQAALVPGARA